MSHKGFSHVGLSTLDLDKTREFFEKVLGFKVVIADTIKIKEGGAIRHIFFDTGRDQLLAFMEPRGIPGVPAEYDAGSIAASARRRPFIISPSRPGRLRRSKTGARN
jgi:catechol 2,3-dioxygenase-like lactoylglutathione lyase family enzyme